MENLINQIRLKFTGAKENKADVGGSRDQKIPITKTKSFKEKKKGQNWFQRQFSRKKSGDYDSREMEHAAAVAATAFAITSREDSEITQQKQKGETPKASLTKTKSKLDGTKSPIFQLGSASKRLSGSFRSTDEGDKVPISSVTDRKQPEKAITPAPSMKKTSTFGEHLKDTDDEKPETSAQKIPPPPPPPPPQPIMQSSTKPGPVRPPTPQTGTGETKADAWERSELQKIKERYERLKETIDSWEKKKKMKARHKLNKEESELERKRLIALEKFQNNMKYINQIAGGARAQAEQIQRNEELKAKEKANAIRTTGKLPGTCPCF